MESLLDWPMLPLFVAPRPRLGCFPAWQTSCQRTPAARVSTLSFDEPSSFARRLAGSACGAACAAFPALRRRRFTRLAFENELGVQPPLGFWDPMGFTDDGDIAAYRRRRSVEFKHGRIAMLATMGFMTPEIIGHWPGYLSPSMGLKFADVPNGLAALNVVPSLGQV